MRILRDVLITFMHMIDEKENRDVKLMQSLFTFITYVITMLMDEY